MDPTIIEAIIGAFATIVAAAIAALAFRHKKDKIKKPKVEQDSEAKMLPKKTRGASNPSNLPFNQQDSRGRGRIPRASPIRFIGRDKELEAILNAFRNPRRPRIVCIDGIGGIGKTALAEEAVRLALSEGIIDRVCWKTAKIEELCWKTPKREEPIGPEVVIISDPVGWSTIRLDFENFKNDRADKRILFVLDNLETTKGINELLIELPQIVELHLCLVTSRERLHFHQDVRSVSLTGLTKLESLELLRSEAQTRSVVAVSSAPEEELLKIASVLEGNPLAIKLVVGLCEYLPIDSVLERLREGKLDRQFADGSIYTFIYHDAWKKLSPLAKKVLIYIGKTTEQSVTLAEIKVIFNRYSQDEVEDATAHLVRMCLLDPNAELHADRRRFSMHALTRTFINTELPSLWNKKHQ